jgi:predicted ribosomally synthesized peptide with SipW-like signal peptide
MKRIVFSLMVIAITASVLIGGTTAFFSDTETSTGNTFTAGTIDVEVDGENPWVNQFVWEDAKPGRCETMTMNIKNVGQNPLKLWKIVKCLSEDENGVVEPEQEWYDENGGPKNDIQSAITYEMLVDGNMVVNQEAGITMDQIADSYVGLLKLDPGAQPEWNGILEVDETVMVEQTYCMKEETGNWAQSDQLTFVIEVEGRQVDAPEPLYQTLFQENKEEANYSSDNKLGLLKYEYQAPTFNYDYFATGLDNKTYQLIYYPDPWDFDKEIVLIGDPMQAINGQVSVTNQHADLGFDIPIPSDNNYGIGAKIWLVQSESLSSNILSWTGYNDEFLFENWPGWINYRQGERPNEEIRCEYTDDNDSGDTTNGDDNTVGTDYDEQISFSSLGAEDQFGGYDLDYSQANVTFDYDYTNSGTVSGHISGSGLKPYATYQLKFEAKPTCRYDSGGDDVMNSYIGDNGRYWNYTTNSNGYSASDCVAGYLVWGYATADENGNISKQVESNNSFHVLRCGGGVCGVTNDAQIQNTDGSQTPPGFPYCDASDVNGELEHDATIPCDSFVFEPDIYDLQFILNEESFHQNSFGTWTAVMSSDIEFEIQ